MNRGVVFVLGLIAGLFLGFGLQAAVDYATPDDIRVPSYGQPMSDAWYTGDSSEGSAGRVFLRVTGYASRGSQRHSVPGDVLADSLGVPR